MSKNCMLCANREVVIGHDRHRRYNRCALDHEMHVNAHMCCEEWKECI